MIVTDATPPTDGELTCPDFSSGISPSINSIILCASIKYYIMSYFTSGEHQITCTWIGSHDAESGLHGYKIGIGIFEGDDSVLPFQDLPALEKQYTFYGKHIEG